MIKYKDEADRVGEFLTDCAELKNGDVVGFRVQNHGRESADVTILYIDSGYGVQSLFPEAGTVANNAVHPGASSTTPQFVLEDLKPGVERVVVIAVRSEGAPIDFSWLEQPTIQQARSALDVKRGGKRHPLDKLFQTAAYGEGHTRAMRRLDLQNYSIRSISWNVSE
jgi:hypothetical protein